MALSVFARRINVSIIAESPIATQTWGAARNHNSTSRTSGSCEDATLLRGTAQDTGVLAARRFWSCFRVDVRTDVFEVTSEDMDILPLAWTSALCGKPRARCWLGT